MWCESRKEKTTTPPEGRRSRPRRDRICLSTPEISERNREGLRRKVSPEIRIRKGDNLKRLSPNHSLSQESGRRGISQKKEERKRKNITKAATWARTRDPPRAHYKAHVKACVPVSLIFVSSGSERERESERQKKKK